MTNPSNASNILHVDPFVDASWHVDDLFPALGPFDCCLDYGICDGDSGKGTPFQCCPGCPNPIGTGPVIPPSCPSQAPPPCTTPLAQASGYHRTFANTQPFTTTTACITSNLGVFLSSSGPTVLFPVAAFAPENLGGSNCGGSIDKHWNSKVKVTVRVAYTYCPNNLPPTANPDVATVCRSLAECPSFTEIPILANDCDADQGCSTGFGKIDCSSVMITQNPAHGSVQVMSCTGVSNLVGCPQTNNCPGCVVRYTPTAGYVGPDTFCYKVGDNGTPQLFSNCAPVSIRVCPGPNVVDDPCVATCMNVPVTFNVLANDTGAAAVAAAPGVTCTTSASCTLPAVAPLPFPACAATTIDCSTLSIVTPPAHGALTLHESCGGLSGNCSSGANCIKYTPTAGFVGTDTFVYKVYDSAGCCDTATVTITTVCPPVANPDNGMVCEANSSCCTGDCNYVLIGVLNNDGACPGTAGCGTNCPATTPPPSIACGSVMIVTPPANGTVMINQACAAAGACQGATNDGCPSNCVKYTPNPGFRGVDTFTYKFTDNRTTPTCIPMTSVFPCQSNVATVSVTVKCAPDAVDDPAYDPDPAVLNDIIIPVLDNDHPFKSGFNDAACTGTTFPANAVSLPSPADAGPCGLPQHGTVTVLPDNSIKYTQTEPLPPEGDQFTYCLINSNGCCSRACVRINPPAVCMRNRRECGSLLLYPEFDNHQQNLTLITITMGCCEYPTGSTKVEFRFINKDNCQEANTTFNLTPCDTLTFTTSAVNPNMTQGYLYAYAKNSTPTPNNPTGTPIVFNHLIGQELIINGILALDYGMNAVAFKAYGANGDDVADNTPNDDDGDGIRDLNGPFSIGPEYDEAPDMICIPRFLGQNSSTDGPFANSSIILINLSGGRAFTTLVDIQGFNDNEVPFSDQYTFYCWAKPRLRDFSHWTWQDSLLGSNHNPNEILGLAEESGWLKLNGSVANSTGPESINDPAIYAVLIEELAGHWAADLPWECDCQTNGALLPISIFGDGDPTPEPGDDQ